MGALEHGAQATLLPAQRDDGSWRPLDVYAEYAGDARDDSIYTTSLCVLTLEVYYRYFTPAARTALSQQLGFVDELRLELGDPPRQVHHGGTHG